MFQQKKVSMQGFEPDSEYCGLIRQVHVETVQTLVNFSFQRVLTKLSNFLKVSSSFCCLSQNPTPFFPSFSALFVSHNLVAFRLPSEIPDDRSLLHFNVFLLFFLLKSKTSSINFQTLFL